MTMKYKVIANGTVMAEDVTAVKAMNMVIGMLQGHDCGKDTLEVKVYYRAGNETVGWCWKLENSFVLRPPA